MTKICFDHCVIFVPDLDIAIQQFSELGFIVNRGGEHKYTCNALIVFRDLTYIEIIALKKFWFRPIIRFAAKIGLLNYYANKKTDTSWRLIRWITKSYGASDWYLRTKNIQHALNSLARNKFPTLKKLAYQRKRPDGQIVQWELGCSKDYDLPFLIEDKTPINLRIAPDNNTKHTNGAWGIKKIILSSKNTDKIAYGLSAVLNENQNQSRKLPKTFSIGNKIISLKQEANPKSCFSLELSYSGNKRKCINTKKTFGAVIWLTPNT